MIYAYKERNKNGNYQTSAGTRYFVYFAARLHGAVRDCWKQYESKEAALEYFGLTEFIGPEAQAEMEALLATEREQEVGK